MSEAETARIIKKYLQEIVELNREMQQVLIKFNHELYNVKNKNTKEGDELIAKVWLHVKTWIKTNKSVFITQPEYGFIDSKNRPCITMKLFDLIIDQYEGEINTSKRKIKDEFAQRNHIETSVEAGKLRFSIVKRISKEKTTRFMVLNFNIKEDKDHEPEDGNRLENINSEIS